MDRIYKMNIHNQKLIALQVSIQVSKKLKNPGAKCYLITSPA